LTKFNSDSHPGHLMGSGDRYRCPGCGSLIEWHPSRADVAAELLRLASLVENSRGDTAVSASVHF